MFALCLGPIVFVVLLSVAVITFSGVVGIDIALLKSSKVYVCMHLFGSCFWVCASVIACAMLVKCFWYLSYLV